jgi:hypothetical protein
VDAVGYITTVLQPTVGLVKRHGKQRNRSPLQPNLGEAILANGFYHYAC